MSPTLATDNVSAKVSGDGLTASLSWAGKSGDPAPSLDDVVSHLKHVGISLEEDVQSRVDAFLAMVRRILEMVQESDDGVEGFVVAEGQPPIHARDERFAWAGELAKCSAEWRDGASFDIYPVHRILHVAAGTLIGVMKPMVHPRDGKNVLGDTIEAIGTPSKLRIGEGLAATSDDPAQIKSTAAGRLVFAEGTASVEPAEVIDRDLEGARGNVSCDKHLFVNGAIADRVTVDCAKSMTVSVAIDAAHVRVGGDLAVRGGIVGRRSGRVRAASDVVAKFCNGANVVAGRDVKIRKQLMNSCIGAGARLMAADAVMVGGCVFARDRAELAVLGSDADVATAVYLGVRADHLAEAMELQTKVDAMNKKIAEVRASVQPLMERAKSMSHEQRQRATELLATVDGIACHAGEKEARRVELMQSAMATNEPELFVRQQIFPRVTVRLGDREMVIQKTLTGPVTIRRQKVDNVTQIVAIDDKTGSVRTLHSQRIPPDELTATLLGDVRQHFDDSGDSAD